MKVEGNSDGTVTVHMAGHEAETLSSRIRRMDQTFITVGPLMIELAESLRSVREQLQGLETSLRKVPEPGMGMTPDGGYKEPQERRSDWRVDEELGERHR